MLPFVQDVYDAVKCEKQGEEGDDKTKEGWPRNIDENRILLIYFTYFANFNDTIRDIR